MKLLDVLFADSQFVCSFGRLRFEPLCVFGLTFCAVGVVGDLAEYAERGAFQV